jgi:uncharacterized protein (TIGR03905 family)
MTSYKTSGVCSSSIEIHIQDNIIENVLFNGGCDGNLKGLSSLVRGMPAEEAIKRLGGIKCGVRGTSCPDQLSKALAGYSQGSRISPA